jgi:hypothetical protein
MLLGPSSAHTWSVFGDAMLAAPIALDCAIASVTAASGIEPSGLARCRYIHSSAPTGSAVAAGRSVAVSLRGSLTAAAPAPSRIMSAVAARIGACVLRIATRASRSGGVPASGPDVHRAAGSRYLRNPDFRLRGGCLHACA